jgi:hypothetical protein
MKLKYKKEYFFLEALKLFIIFVILNLILLSIINYIFKTK